MTSSRFQRRPLLLSILLIASLYLAVSQLRKPGVDLRILPSWTSQSISPLHYASHLRNQVVLNAPASSPAAAPGFERALPSCRVADLVDDPLVKEYGQNNIRLSRTYEGSGARVRKLLQKTMRGEKIKIAAVGGSVSTVRTTAVAARKRVDAYTLHYQGHGVPYPHTSENYMSGLLILSAGLD